MYGFEERLVTRNTPVANESLRLQLIDGPFKHLDGMWQFIDLDVGCRVNLELDCEFESGLMRLVTSSLVKRGIEKTVTAFIQEVRRRHDRNL